MSDMGNTNTSPDMVQLSSVIRVITNNANCFKNEKALANIVAEINSLTKYDLKPVADNITNNNTTVNVIAEDDKVRDFLIGLKSSLGKGKRW